MDHGRARSTIDTGAAAEHVTPRLGRQYLTARRREDAFTDAGGRRAVRPAFPGSDSRENAAAVHAAVHVFAVVARTTMCSAPMPLYTASYYITAVVSLSRPKVVLKRPTLASRLSSRPPPPPLRRRIAPIAPPPGY